MKNAEKVVLPLTAGAAVLGIWLAFRKPAAPTEVQAGSVQLPPIPPLVDNHFGVPYSDYGPVAPAAGGGQTSHGQYLHDSAREPLNSAPLTFNINPNAQPNPYAYLTYNGAPWDVYNKALTRHQQIEAGDGVKVISGGCGCGGGCGSKSNLAAKCSQDANPRLMDGHGDCLTTRPRFLNGSAIQANTRYVAASYDDSVLGAQGDFIEAHAGTVVSASGLS